MSKAISWILGLHLRDQRQRRLATWLVILKANLYFLSISNSILVLEGKGIGEKKKEIGLKKTKKREYKL